MLQAPVPVPRTKISLPAKTSDDKPVESSSPHQSLPTSPPEIPKWFTPPPVAPKPWIITTSSENGEIRKIQHVPLHRPPPPLPKKELDTENIQHVPLHHPTPPLPITKLDAENEAVDAKSFSDSFKNMQSWSDLCKDLTCLGLSEERIIEGKAIHLYKAMLIYIYHMTDHGGNLKQLIDDLICIADNLNKVSKGTKIAGITGGATTVAGGVAAAAGVILSPFTMGASLALTVVGVGVATAGGVTGASAAIANKANAACDKKKMDKILHDFSSQYEDMLDCLRFINEGIKLLKQHDLSALSNSEMGSKRAVKVVEVVMASETSIMTSGVISGFALGMDLYFTKHKDGYKVKKGMESKLAQKIRVLSEDLNKGLTELVKIKELFSRC